MKNLLLIFLIIFFSLFIFNQVCQASISSGVESFGQKVYGQDAQPQDLRVLTGKIISSLLGLLGVVFLVLTIYGGYLYMTAAGKDEQIKQAKKVIVSAVIGLIIVILSYAIAQFVLTAFLRSTANSSLPVGDSDVTTDTQGQ